VVKNPILPPMSDLTHFYGIRALSIGVCELKPLLLKLKHTGNKINLLDPDPGSAFGIRIPDLDPWGFLNTDLMRIQIRITGILIKNESQAWYGLVPTHYSPNVYVSTASLCKETFFHHMFINIILKIDLP